ncbi:MAG TPA: hypothetical protein ENH91_00085 [Leeuwenhoekiella sp.]|nr:hypothetical protein [Leeuwenhoekiella sp.]
MNPAKSIRIYLSKDVPTLFSKEPVVEEGPHVNLETDGFIPNAEDHEKIRQSVMDIKAVLDKY